MISTRLDVFAKDRNGTLIPGSDFEFTVDGKQKGKVKNSGGRASFERMDKSSVAVTVKVRGEKPQSALIAADQAQYVFSFAQIVIRDDWLSRYWAVIVGFVVLVVGTALGVIVGVEQHLPLLVGLLLAAIAITLAFVYSHPTRLQRQIILVLLSLGGGAIATEIPGLLNVDINFGTKVGIGAAGALAVFVVLFFFMPAGSED